MKETYTIQEFEDDGDGLHVVLVKDGTKFKLEIEGAAETGWMSTGEFELDLNNILYNIGYRIVKDINGLDE